MDAVMPRLTVERVQLAYGARAVLGDLSFTVGAGEIFGLLGPNGAGKSTAFAVLAGLLPAQGGAIRLDGELLSGSDRRLRARLGVVFQDPSLDQRLTVRENLFLSAQLYGLSGARAASRITELLQFSEIADRAGDTVKTLSGGLRRRVELARALLHAPDVLLLDEPTSGLDEASFQRTWARLAALRKQTGLTILLTTHRPEEAERCDRVGVLDGGKLVAVDSPNNLKHRVAGDVVELDCDGPEEVVTLLTERLALPARVREGRVIVERERGHELIPRIVEALPAGRLRSVSLRRPTLADVFLKLTGHGLDHETLQ